MSIDASALLNNSASTNLLAVTAPSNDTNKIDVGGMALNILASTVMTVTNSILTITVSAMKLTRFSIITSLALGHLTKPLHACNKFMAKHAFTPFKKWSEMLGNENERIIETEKVFSIENKKLYFNTKNFKNSAKDSFKAIIAPISLAFSVTNAALWLAVKPLWLALLPGIAADCLVTAPIALNKQIGRLTYAPVKGISDWMFEKHCKYLDEVALPKRGF